MVDKRLLSDMPYLLRNYVSISNIAYLPGLSASRRDYLTGVRDASDIYDSLGCLDAPQFIPSGSTFRTPTLGTAATMIVER